MWQNPMQMISAFFQFKNQFQGNPQAEVQKLMQQGRLTQPQLDQLQAQARQFQQMLERVKF